jgi:hypothetical protein
MTQVRPRLAPHVMMEDMGRLFEPVPEEGNWQHYAVVGGDEDDELLAMGFAEAGDLIVQSWTTEGPNDLLFVPFAYLYRHAFELVLKAAIRETAARLRVEHEADAEIDASDLNKRMTRKPLGHNPWRPPRLISTSAGPSVPRG